VTEFGAEHKISERTFSSNEVMRLVQVSLRQLQWWEERKVVSPYHNGHRRIYQSQDVLEIAIIAELRRKGFSLQKIRWILRYLQKTLHVDKNGYDLYVVTDGRTCILTENETRVVEIFRDSVRPLWLVSVAPLWLRIQQWN